MAEVEPGLNPKILSLSYRPNSGVVPNELVTLNPYTFFRPASSIEIKEKPNWLTVILESMEDEDGNGSVNQLVYKVAVNSRYANNLGVGLHTSEVKIYGEINPFGIPGRATYTLKVNLRVLEYNALSVSQGIYTFKFTRGNQPPSNQFMNIKSSNNWSIAGDKSWLSFSQNNGEGNATISLGVDPANLPNGLHLGKFVVSDGDDEKEVYVYLVIRGTGDENDYLNISPQVLTFSENYGVTASKEAKFTIDASVNTALSANVNWLELDATNAQAGIQAVKVNTINTAILGIGSYPAQIDITSSTYGTETIDVLLNIVSEETTGIESNRLYFADDRVQLQLTSAESNAEAVLDFVTAGTLETSRYRKKAPFYRNSASIIIGQETDILLVPAVVPELASQVFNPVTPISMDFEVFDKEMGNAAMFPRESYTNVRFLNGRSSIVLSKIPGELTMPVDGVLCFSFLQEATITEASIIGDYTGSIPVNQTGDVVSFLLKLSDLELQPRDNIKITCGPVQVSVRIKPTELPTTYLIWQNEWDCPEVFNCDGILEIQGERDSKVVVNNRSGKDYSKVIDIKKPKTFNLGTGNVYSEAEADFLASILDSRRLWLESNGERWEVIADFRSLKTSETRRQIRNFTLKFNSAVK